MTKLNTTIIYLGDGSSIDVGVRGQDMVWRDLTLFCRSKTQTDINGMSYTTVEICRKGKIGEKIYVPLATTEEPGSEAWTIVCETAKHIRNMLVDQDLAGEEQKVYTPADQAFFGMTDQVYDGYVNSPLRNTDTRWGYKRVPH